MLPTRRSLLLLGLALLIGITATLLPPLLWLAIALDVALVAAWLWEIWALRQVELAAERLWPRLLAQGQAIELDLHVHNRSARDLVVQLREVLHPALAALPVRVELAVPAGSGVSWRPRIEPRRRGEHETGPLMARILGPWGLIWQQRQLIAPERRRVYPQVRWEGKVGHLVLLADRRALGHNPQRIQGLGTEPYALREYRSGDPPNKIHWKAAARHGRLITREETWERGARLIVLLDAGRSMTGIDGQRSKLDHALAAALALVRVAAARGDRVTLASFKNRVERTVRIHGGHRSLQAAYGALYDLDAEPVEPAFDLAAEAAVSFEARRSTVVLFTSVVDLAAADLLRQAMLRLERRHRPILLNLEDPELIALAYGAPQKPEAAFAKVAALEILQSNRRLATQLRHAGIRVVNCPADRLALEALEAYLTMFGVGT